MLNHFSFSLLLFLISYSYPLQYTEPLLLPPSFKNFFLSFSASVNFRKAFYIAPSPLHRIIPNLTPPSPAVAQELKQRGAFTRCGEAGNNILTILHRKYWRWWCGGRRSKRSNSQDVQLNGQEEEKSNCKRNCGKEKYKTPQRIVQRTNTRVSSLLIFGRHLRVQHTGNDSIYSIS